MARSALKLDFSDVPSIVRDFLNYKLTIQGRSVRTVEAYHVDLRLFLRFIYCYKNNNYAYDVLADIDISMLETDFICLVRLPDVYEFLNFTLSDRDNNASTRARKVSSIKALYKYLSTKTTHLKENPVEHLESPSPRKSLPKYLNLNQALDLLGAAEGDGHPDSIRDYCMIVLFLNCGMRLSELVGINIKDINLEQGSLKLLGKGNKERIVYLNDACKSALSSYLPIRTGIQSKDPSALFLSRQYRRISPRRVEQIVDGYLKKAGLDGQGYSPHKLRHTAATLMYQHGDVDIRVLQLILGHAGLSTTQIYTHVSESQLQKAADRSPLARTVRSQTKKTLTKMEEIALDERSADHSEKEE